MAQLPTSYEKVYKLVQQIPKGKVTTYGEIGRKLHMSPRVVGMALHHNPDSDLTPCHRVVNRDGRVAPHFAFGGKDIQKKLLESEGVEFKDESNVDLKKSFYSY
jgi:methylated-DNA-protein-cysteine methyltransferase-like protein